MGFFGYDVHRLPQRPSSLRMSESQPTNHISPIHETRSFILGYTTVRNRSGLPPFCQEQRNELEIAGPPQDGEPKVYKGGNSNPFLRIKVRICSLNFR
jgi:hypothetical protein